MVVTWPTYTFVTFLTGQSLFQEKSEAEEQICHLQKMWETEKAKEAEKISDLVKARELLLDSKGTSMSFYRNFTLILS